MQTLVTIIHESSGYVLCSVVNVVEIRMTSDRTLILYRVVSWEHKQERRQYGQGIWFAI